VYWFYQKLEPLSLLTRTEINGAICYLFSGKRNVTLVPTVGLDGTNKTILTKGNWIFWGTDLPATDEALPGEYNFQLDKYLLRYKVKLADWFLPFPTEAVVSKIII